MAAVDMTGTERVRRLRERMIVKPEICLERGYLVTRSYQETESEPAVVRRAKALAAVLREMTIEIDEDELIVGRATSKRRGAPLLPETRWEWLLAELDTFATREIDRFAPLSAAEKAKMKEFLPYWKDRAAFDKWKSMVPDYALSLSQKIQSGGGGGGFVGHTSPDYEGLLAHGLNGIQAGVQARLKALDLADIDDLNQYQFLRAVDITLSAARDFAGRYAELAGEMAEKESDLQRKAELIKVAETCRRVPAYPARDLYEALQSIWLTHCIVMIEAPASYNFGRVDQYLYPYYKKDLDEGRATREEARELLALFLIKANEFVRLSGQAVLHMTAGFSQTQSLTLGGVNRTGEDAVNDLSYLFLDAEMDVRLSKDDFVIRVHHKTPDAFVIRACEVARALGGKLKFLSDETTIRQLLHDGRPVEHARDYVCTGCFTITVPVHSLDHPGQLINLPLMMELALNNGTTRLDGVQIGPKTGDARQFKSYDEVWDAYRKQVEALIPVINLLKNSGKLVTAQYCQVPFQSSLFPSCIEKGVDIAAGGTAPYLSDGIALAGAANVGDSLAAIKKVVFEEKKITMAELIDALQADFKGHEKILHLLEQAPKFGNDDDYVDSIVDEVLAHASDEAAKTRGLAGGLSTASASSGPASIPMGGMVGALPDGRRAGEALAEGGISPHQGRNISGPTATLRSVATLDHLKFTNGSVVNMKFNPDAVKDEAKLRKFAAMVRTHLETGGGLVQFNILSADTLRDAQKNPDNYRDLLVRVATYSAYFVDLPLEIQNDIIARTEFQGV